MAKDPIILSGGDKEYKLEFTRDSVRYACRQGFNVEDLMKDPISSSEDLFFYSFRANHPEVNFDKAMHILYDEDGLGGINSELVRELGARYSDTYVSLLNDGDGEKKSKMTIKF